MYRKVLHCTSFVFVIALNVFSLCAGTNHCVPGLECWPDSQTIALFIGNISNPKNVLLPYRPEYDNITIMKNTRVIKFPAFIVVARTVHDIQQSILFAKKYNIPLSVQSSGHDYQGRSTSYGSLQIYLGGMTNINVNLSSTRNPAGEVTVESGAQWINVYKEVDKYNRVVIGGSAHTVAIGGYTLGGGHSPMSRMFGLAVDNLLEVEMVTADGKVVTLTENETKNTSIEGDVVFTNDSDLFWALKGGGGGTYGIVTKFTFKLHPAAPAVVNFDCQYPINDSTGAMIGDKVLYKFFDVLQRMPKEWGGYMLVGGSEYSKTKSRGTITFFLNHYGPWDSDSRIFMDEMKNYNPAWQKYCIYKNYSTFLQYELTAIDALYYSNYVQNILVKNDTLKFPSGLVSLLIQYVFTYPLLSSAFGFTGTLIGGRTQVISPDETPLHPGFRTSLMSLSGALVWSPVNTKNENTYIANAVTFGRELRTYGYGMYRNEAGGNLTTWKTDFWGNHYDELLRIKRYWDPDNVFTCHDCVGRDDYHHDNRPYNITWLTPINGSPHLTLSLDLILYVFLLWLMNMQYY